MDAAEVRPEPRRVSHVTGEALGRARPPFDRDAVFGGGLALGAGAVGRLGVLASLAARLAPRSARAVCVASRRLFLVGAGSVAFALQGCSGDADFSDVMPEPVTLQAEAYRSEITGVDRLVFEEGPYTGKRGRALAATLEALAARVKAASDSRFLLLESLELRRLGSVARDYPPDSPRAPLQNDWMRLRSNLFDDREWFARSASDLEAEPHSGGGLGAPSPRSN